MKERVAEEKGGAVGWAEGEGCVEAGEIETKRQRGVEGMGWGQVKREREPEASREREVSVAVIRWFVRGMIL